MLSFMQTVCAAAGSAKTGLSKPLKHINSKCLGACKASACTQLQQIDAVMMLLATC